MSYLSILFKSISIKVVLLFLFITVLSLLSSIIIYNNIYEKNEKINDLKADLLHITIGLSEQQIQITNGIKQLMETIALLPIINVPDVKECGILFSKIVKEHPQYAAMGLVDFNGDLIVHSSDNYISRSVNFSEQKHIVDAKNTLKFSVGEFIIGKISKTRSIHYGYPILDKNNQVKFILTIGIKLDEYSKYINSSRLPINSALIIFDHKGIRIYRCPENTMAAIGTAPSKRLFEMDESDSGFFERVADDGIERYFAYQKIRLNEESNPYLTIAVGIPKSGIVAEANQHSMELAIYLGIVSLLLLALIQITTDKFIIKNINHLVDITSKFGDQINIRTGILHNKTEVGKLAKAFDMMADRIEQKEIENIRSLKIITVSEKKFKSYIESSPIGIFVADENGFLIECNSKGKEILQCDTVVDIHITDLYPKACKEDITNLFYTVQQEKQLHVETQIITQRGELIWVLLNVVVLSNGTSLAYIMDISNRKRMEAERIKLEDRLVRAEKMEALGTLAGGIAHDLNNILGVVIGYTELLLIILTDKEATYATEVLNGGKRAAAIIQDMLTLTRRGVPNKCIINLNDLINEYLNSSEVYNIFNENINVKMDLDSDIYTISGSDVHITKSIFNLILNAIESMPNGGSITIKTRTEYLEEPIFGYDEIKEGNYVVLTVSDTGCGISKKDINRIFEPFYTKKFMGRSGTGLGLTVVWGTVKDHYGYINVESEEGKGTTFYLYFPVTVGDVIKNNEIISMDDYTGNKEHILIVDDIKEQREVAKEILTKLNYNVCDTTSGEAAIEYLSENTVDLVVLDMIMNPGIDGLDTYIGMLNINEKQKAIIVSGFSETERVTNALKLGVGAYVKKPYTIEKLGLAVKSELSKNTR